MSFPVGIFTDVSATALGAVFGCFLGGRLSERWKYLLNNLMGVAALVMGIVLIIRARNLSAVVLALLAGAVVGTLLKLEDRVNTAANDVTSKLLSGSVDETGLGQIAAVLALFCLSGTGWYGALNEGLTGDGSSSSPRRSSTALPPASLPPS